MMSQRKLSGDYEMVKN